MRYTIEELRGDWHVIREGVVAPREWLAVARVSEEAGAGMYRTAAPIEPNRHYFWCSAGGELEEMDR